MRFHQIASRFKPLVTGLKRGGERFRPVTALCCERGCGRAGQSGSGVTWLFVVGTEAAQHVTKAVQQLITILYRKLTPQVKQV